MTETLNNSFYEDTYKYCLRCEYEKEFSTRELNRVLNKELKHGILMYGDYNLNICVDCFVEIIESLQLDFRLALNWTADMLHITGKPASQLLMEIDKTQKSVQKYIRSLK